MDSITRKAYKKLLHKAGRAIEDFSLIRNGDNILVAVSGGKDSMTMLRVLSDLKKKAPSLFL